MNCYYINLFNFPSQLRALDDFVLNAIEIGCYVFPGQINAVAQLISEQSSHYRLWAFRQTDCDATNKTNRNNFKTQNIITQYFKSKKY